MPEAMCRHCGKKIWQTPPPNSTWCDDDGFAACVKGQLGPRPVGHRPGERLPSVPPVLHEPMPAGLRGEATGI